jgi:O-acetylhomoserine/O-acetylserine sulfhydrylase-like pyridoxal-dependent enzyme
MRSDTVAVHGGYETEPTTRAVAVPIYQTVAYEFDSADHGAALFNLEAEGHRYSRISNPTTAVLERRVAALEGGVEALCVSSGQAALNYAVLNLASMGSNIVSVPQLYGTTHTLFAHVLPSQGVEVRFAGSDAAEAVEKLIDQNTRAVFCESVGNPAGNICDIAALAAVAARHGIPLIVDNTVATPILLRPIDHGADIVVHSLTKFMGGHGTTLGGAIVDSGRFPWAAHARRFPMFSKPDASYHGLATRSISATPPTSPAAAASINERPGLSSRRCRPSYCCRGSRPWRCGSSATSRTRAAPPNSCVLIRAWPGSITPASRIAPTTRWYKNISADAPVRCSLSASSAVSKPANDFTTRSS